MSVHTNVLYDLNWVNCSAIELANKTGLACRGGTAALACKKITPGGICLTLSGPAMFQRSHLLCLARLF